MIKKHAEYNSILYMNSSVSITNKTSLATQKPHVSIIAFNTQPTILETAGKVEVALHKIRHHTAYLSNISNHLSNSAIKF